MKQIELAWGNQLACILMLTSKCTRRLGVFPMLCWWFRPSQALTCSTTVHAQMKKRECTTATIYSNELRAGCSLTSMVRSESDDLDDVEPEVVSTAPYECNVNKLVKTQCTFYNCGVNRQVQACTCRSAQFWTCMPQSMVFLYWACARFYVRNSVWLQNSLFPLAIRAIWLPMLLSMQHCTYPWRSSCETVHQKSLMKDSVQDTQSKINCEIKDRQEDFV